MDLWTSQSNPGKQTTLSVACALVGLLLTIGFRNFSGSCTNVLAGFLLGVLLLLIGVVGFMVNGKQTVVINPKARSITVEESNRFGIKKRIILFSDIDSVSIGYLGKKSNFVTWYYLELDLKNGERYPLFSPVRFFEGGSDRAIVASWKQRLEDFLCQ